MVRGGGGVRAQCVGRGKRRGVDSSRDHGGSKRRPWQEMKNLRMDVIERQSFNRFVDLRIPPPTSSRTDRSIPENDQPQCVFLITCNVADVRVGA
jgi:hypothetical protein